jgi:hypothetical protein
MSRLLRAATAALALAAFNPAAHAADPTGSWKFDPKSLEALADSMADRMAAEVTPEQQSLQAEALKDLEARQQEMQKSDPAAAQQMADRLKEARDQDAAMRADPKGYFRQSFMAGLQTLEKVRLRLEPGGKVVVAGAESGGEGDNGEGTWKLDGDKIEIAAAMPDEEGQGQPERMTGTFTGDRMELRPVETPPDEAVPGEEGSDDSAADEDKDSGQAEEGDKAADQAEAQSEPELPWVLVRSND